MEPRWCRVGAYVVCRDKDKRLLLTRFVKDGDPLSGSWTIPGGRMEWGEQPADTALRELDEETGLHARIGRVLGVVSRWLEPHETASGEAGHRVGIIYESHETEGQLRTTFEPGTTDAAQWFTIDELRTFPRVRLVDHVLELLQNNDSAAHVPDA